MEKQPALLGAVYALSESTLTRNGVTVTFPAHKIRLESEPFPSSDWKAHKFKFTIGGRSFEYSTGLGHRHIKPELEDSFAAEYATAMRQSDVSKLLPISHANLPTIEDFMYCIVSDAYASICSFGDWADEFGYARDRAAKSIYNACIDYYEKMQKAWPDFDLDEVQEYFQDF